MNQMVFELQPDIIVNNRNGLEGDFSTPEQEVRAARVRPRLGKLHDPQRQLGLQSLRRRAGRLPRPSSPTSPTARAAAATTCSTSAPSPTAPFPSESVTVLEAVGNWLDTNGKAIYGAERGDFSWNINANYTRRGNTLYVHQQFWPGHTPAADWLRFYQPQAVIALGGLKTKRPLRPHAQDRPESRVHPGRILASPDRPAH